MNQKLQKTVREIERAQAKIAELQALLPGLEKQRTELENLEIISLVRSANIAPRELRSFIGSLRAGSPFELRSGAETEASGNEG
jgi:hypothetical protein